MEETRRQSDDGHGGCMMTDSKAERARQKGVQSVNVAQAAYIVEQNQRRGRENTYIQPGARVISVSGQRKSAPREDSPDKAQIK